MTVPAANPFASVVLVIDRPARLIDALFFDLDHALRAPLHEGVTLTPLPEGPGGERLLRQESQVMGRVQTEDVTFERAGDGSWVKRFVAGVNAGGRLVARFTPEGEERTRIQLSAFAPATGFSLGIGKASALGMEKHLQRLLTDYQRALASYTPPDDEPVELDSFDIGVDLVDEAPRAMMDSSLPPQDVPAHARPPAVGQEAARPPQARTDRSLPRARVLDALDELSDLTEALTRLPHADLRPASSNVMACAYLVVAAGSGGLAAERDTIREVARRFFSLPLTEDDIEQAVQAMSAAIDAQGLETRCKKVGGRLAALGVDQLAIAASLLITLSSGAIGDRERAAIDRIGAAAGMPAREVASIQKRVLEALGSV
jgi:tellurite resistance protein